jgi:hypothetical protein
MPALLRLRVKCRRNPVIHARRFCGAAVLVEDLAVLPYHGAAFIPLFMNAGPSWLDGVGCAYCP